MLFRRSKWTKQFLDSVAELGRVPEPELGEVAGPFLSSRELWGIKQWMHCLSCLALLLDLLRGMGLPST